MRKLKRILRWPLDLWTAWRYKRKYGIHIYEGLREYGKFVMITETPGKALTEEDKEKYKEALALCTEKWTRS